MLTTITAFLDALKERVRHDTEREAVRLRSRAQELIREADLVERQGEQRADAFDRLGSVLAAATERAWSCVVPVRPPQPSAEDAELH